MKTRKKTGSALACRRLFLSTTILAAALSGYGRKAEAACTPSGGSNFSCTGFNLTTQTINANNATVTTDPGFSVNTFLLGGNGITITGNGDLSFADVNNSPITANNPLSGNARGLFIDNGGGNGSISVYTTGDIVGRQRGIFARNDANGILSVTANGSVTGETDHGLFARNGNIGGNVIVTTGIGSSISGNNQGLRVQDLGLGTTTVTVNGDVTANVNDAIWVRDDRSGLGITVTTGADADVLGNRRGIDARHFGSGFLTVTANGNVTSTTSDGIFALNRRGTNLAIVTGAGRTISARTNGINLRNRGSGTTSVNANGTITAIRTNGIVARGDASTTTLSITTGAGSSITARRYGIFGRHFGSDAFTVTVDGTITSNTRAGVFARNYNSANFTVTTIDGSAVTGQLRGINARNTGSGIFQVTANGAVTGTTQQGLYARNQTGTNLSVTTGINSAIMGNFEGIFARNDGTGSTTVTANGSVNSATREGIEVRNTSGTSLTVNTGTGSNVVGASDGIYGRQAGTGILSSTVNGTVTGGTGEGVDLYNVNGTDLNVTTGVASNIMGNTYGIRTRNAGTGNTTLIVDGAATATNGAGIFARNEASAINLSVTTGASSSVSGNSSGIQALNNGSGAVNITANGAVTGTTGDGIYTTNSAAGTDLMVTTGASSNVSGGYSGIAAQNYGSGSSNITANGLVMGTNGFGISAYNAPSTVDLTITTGVGSFVSGYSQGISARNNGTGETMITANGDVLGTNAVGISAVNAASASNLTVTTGNDTAVTGSFAGIRVRNFGTGITNITANGDVTGTVGNGIYALNTAIGTSMMVTTGTGSNVVGDLYGISARNYGTGAVSVVANGDVTGTTGFGILASNNEPTSTDVSVTTGAGTSINGGTDGIRAVNTGSGMLDVTVNGDVVGSSLDGIFADNKGTSLSITTGAGSSVSGGMNAINAQNYGSGATTLTVNGDATGAAGDGIFAFNTGTILDVTTGPGTVSGSVDGLDIQNYGTGATTISINGNVMGGSGAGVNFKSGGPAQTLNNFGAISSQNHQAILNGDNASTINNNGWVTGFVTLGRGVDIFNNAGGGVFDTLGTSDFGAGADSFTNAGLITLAGNGAPSSATFTNLETFFNAGGAINLQNGVTGDSLTLTDGAGGLSYTGGGVFLTDIGDPNIGDKLIIDGMIASGTTGISATVVNGAGPEGPVDVVEVSNGTSVGDFILAGPVTNTIYEYDLSLNGDGQTWQLIRTGEVVDEVSVAAVLPSILLGDTRQFVGRLEDRMTAARGRGFLPIADIDNPSAAPAAPERFSTWARIEGYAAKDKGTIDATAVDVPARYDESLGFLQGGASATLMDDADGRFIASLFGHYGQSESDVTDVDGDQGQFTIDSYGIAGALTYFSRSGFYGDAMVLYSKHDVKSVSATNTVDKTDGKTLALSFEAGWKIGVSEAFSIIPQAQIVYQDTNIDDLVSANGIDIDFRDGESLEGRFGVTWHYEEPLTQLDKTLRLHMRTDIVHEFKENAVTTVNGVGLGFNQRGTGFELGAGAWMLPVTGRGIKWGAKVDVRTPFDKSKGRRSVAGSALVGVNW